MKKNIKKISKEWIELTLCNMMDDVLQFMRSGKSENEILEKIKEYSSEIYNAQ